MTSTRVGASLLAAIVAAAVVFAGVSAVRADSTPELPGVAASQLLASTLDALAAPASIWGDVSTRVDPGFRDLPADVGVVPGPASSIVGDQRYEFWRSAAGVRVAHLLPHDEHDMVANPTDVWFWDLRTMKASHVSLPAPAAGDPERAAAPSIGDPLRLAGDVLAAVRPLADVSVSGTASVAGRPVYELVLTPRSTLTPVGRISVGVDATTRLPLEFRIFVRDATDPAVEFRFMSVSFGPIPISTFVFSPPPGGRVRQLSPAVVLGRPLADGLDDVLGQLREFL